MGFRVFPRAPDGGEENLEFQLHKSHSGLDSFHTRHGGIVANGLRLKFGGIYKDPPQFSKGTPHSIWVPSI